MPKSIAARFGMTQSPKLLSQWIAGPGCSGLTDHARPRTGTSFAVTTKLGNAGKAGDVMAVTVSARPGPTALS